MQMDIMQTNPDSLAVTASALGAVGHRFASPPRHTKDDKNGTVAPLLTTLIILGGHLLSLVSLHCPHQENLGP